LICDTVWTRMKLVTRRSVLEHRDRRSGDNGDARLGEVDGDGNGDNTTTLASSCGRERVW
jgi:hypothetical protein